MHLACIPAGIGCGFVKNGFGRCGCFGGFGFFVIQSPPQFSRPSLAGLFLWRKQMKLVVVNGVYVLEPSTDVDAAALERHAGHSVSLVLEPYQATPSRVGRRSRSKASKAK